MKSISFVRLPWASVFFCLFIVLHPLVFANSNNQELFVTYQDARYPTIDLQLASPDELKSITAWIAQNPSKNTDQKMRDAWIQGWIATQAHDYATAERFFKQIPQDQPLSAWGKFMTLFALLESQPMSAKDSFWTQLATKLDALAYRLPTAFAQNYELARYAQSLFQSTQMPWHDSMWEMEQKLDLLKRYPNQLQNHKVWAAQQWLKQTKKTLSKTDYAHFQQKLHLMFPDQIEPAWPIVLPSGPGKAVSTPSDMSEAGKLYKEAKLQQEKGHTQKMLEIWNTIATNYPTTLAASETQRDLEQWLAKSTPDSFKKKWASELLKYPPTWLYQMSRQLWNADRNQNALKLLTFFQKEYAYHEKASNMTYMLASIYEKDKQYSKAIEQFERLAQQYPQDPYADRAWVKAGLWSMHIKDYHKAQQCFEQDLLLALRPLARAQDHYWLAKALLAQNKVEDAKKQIAIIQDHYPLTYYAILLPDPVKLIAKKESDVLEGGQAIPEQKQLDLYLGIGFHSWAKNWVAAHQNDQPGELFAIVEYLKARNLLYLYSMNIAYTLINDRAFDHHLELPLLTAFFPLQPYEDYIKETDTSTLSKLLITSIAKQESAFDARALSPANARGMLQMLPATGKQMATKLNVPFETNLLWDPKTNLQLGSQYVLQNLDRFDQHLPLTLSAYNAGPTRASRWEKQLADLDPDLWIEMIPFQETRTYVKLILRNAYFYQRMYPDSFKESLDFKGLPTPLELP